MHGPRALQVPDRLNHSWSVVPGDRDVAEAGIGRTLKTPLQHGRDRFTGRTTTGLQRAARESRLKAVLTGTWVTLYAKHIGNTWTIALLFKAGVRPRTCQGSPVGSRARGLDRTGAELLWFPPLTKAMAQPSLGRRKLCQCPDSTRVSADFASAGPKKCYLCAWHKVLPMSRSAQRAVGATQRLRGRARGPAPLQTTVGATELTRIGE